MVSQVHDALQFIKAGSLTLVLGVAVSAASLAFRVGGLLVNVM
jgi:ATP-dependent protease ClpP protease subunit